MTNLAVWANSSAEPNLFGNARSLTRLAFVFSLILSVIADENAPGAIVTTRMPWRARSRDIGRVMLTRAPLDAE